MNRERGVAVDGAGWSSNAYVGGRVRNGLFLNMGIVESGFSGGCRKSNENYIITYFVTIHANGSYI